MPKKKNETVPFNRAEKYKVRYRAIRSVYKDSQMAKKWQTRSDERIYRELGIKIPDSAPKPKPLPSDRHKKARVQREAKLKLEKYQYAIEYGFMAKEAKKLRNKSWDKLKRKTMEKELGGGYVAYDWRSYFQKPTSKKERKHREGMWANWAKKENDYPQWVKDLVRQANETIQPHVLSTVKVDIDSSKYGWGVVYYAFTYGYPINIMVQQVQYNKFDGDMYKALIQGM